MSSGSPAIDGVNYMVAASHPMTMPTGTGFAETVLTVGSWVAVCSTDAWLKQGKTGMSVATVPATRAAGAAMPSQNQSFFLPAGVPIPFEVRTGAEYISGIAVSLAGTLTLSGPILR